MNEIAVLLTLILSTAALVVALVAVALAVVASARMRAYQQQVNEALVEITQALEAVSQEPAGVGSWIGNAEDGYELGEFAVRPMPVRGFGGFFRALATGDEHEWVAFHAGQRVFAHADLAAALGYCESLMVSTGEGEA